MEILLSFRFQNLGSMYIIIIVLFFSFGFSLDSYRGAVVQLEDMFNPVSMLIPFVGEAKSKNVEILVFPENGVHSPYPWEFVEIGSCPCEDPQKPVQSNISCAAKSNEIYVVFNIVEHGEKCMKGTDYCNKLIGYYIYNTAVVMNRTGYVIQKYRKHHPYTPGKKIFKPGPPETVTFDTDFGVRFGVFICFDILWHLPSGDVVRKEKVNNIVYMIHWVDNDWLLGTEVQQGYSQYYQVNLLASNGVSLSRGSGIFSKGSVLAVNDDFANIMLVADIPIFPYEEPPQPPTTPLLPWKNEFDVHSFQGSPGKEGYVKATILSHTCEFSFKVKEGYENFTLAAVSLKTETVGEVCVITNCGQDQNISIGCFNEYPETVFEYLYVNMTTVDDIVAVYPGIGTTGKLPIQEQYEEILFVHEGKNHYIGMKDIKDPISFVFHYGVLNVD